MNRWPFDSYAIAWDRAHAWRLIGNLLALAVPFTCAGALVGALLADRALHAGRVYGANMIGSALGAGIAPLLIARIGDARMIVLCSGLGAVTALLLMPPGGHRARLVALAAGVGIVLSGIGLLRPPDALAIQPSPYKALSHFRHVPEATLDAPRYNAYSRLDVVHSSTIHSAPGFSSLTYWPGIPPEAGLLIDGDQLLPVLQAASPLATPDFAAAMPAAVAFALTDAPDVLILGAGGGLDAWVALHSGARSVVAVEPNSLVVDALRGSLREWAGLADDPRVDLVHREIRTYIRQTDRRFDVVQLGLTDPHRPITSGAFTLTENYTLTVEAFEGYLARLAPDGVLVVSRWYQRAPSEELRTLGLIIDALDRSGRDPALHIAAFRAFNSTVTFLVTASPLTPADMQIILAETARLKYDMLLGPDLPPNSRRQSSVVPPAYYDTFDALLAADDRDAFYDEYAFDVRPPTDDRPFFFHFFKWRQTPDILDQLGRTWQPFGGSGYFVLVALLGFALVAALVFILLPVALRSSFRATVRAAGVRRSAGLSAYFGSLGLAYLLIEVATIQQFVLILGQPTLALAAVLGAILLFSGIGSLLAERAPWGPALLALTALALAWPWITGWLADPLLGLAPEVRFPLAVLLLAPLGLLMGMPFARGLIAIRAWPDLTPWAWAINGGASVVSAVLATMLALSAGFTWVLWVGGALYGAAWLTRPQPNPRA